MAKKTKPVVNINLNRTGIPIAAALILCHLLCGCGDLAQQPRAPGNPLPQGRPRQERKLIDEVNYLRTSRGLNSLRQSAQLSAVARKYSSEQAAAGGISHADRSGGHLEDRLRRAGLDNWQTAGENLAMNNADNPTGQALRGWQLSAEHRANLLDKEYNHVGAGIVTVRKNGQATNYITMIFTRQ